MKPKTVAALRALEKVEWFHAVGKPDLTGVKQVSSWMEAVAFCVGREWSNVHTEAFNIFYSRLDEKSKTRYKEASATVDRLRPVVRELVVKKIETVVRLHKLPDAFLVYVDADILGVAIECEHADIVEPGVYTKIIGDCYLKGHFPCGWEGEFPQGRLIAY